MDLHQRWIRQDEFYKASEFDEASSNMRSRRVSTPNIRTLRLLHVAVGAGARYIRERGPIEPLHWLLTPGKIFDGRCAYDVSRSTEGFRRAVVAQALSLDLNTAPAAVAGIPAAAFLNDLPGGQTSGDPPIFLIREEEGERGQPALYTSTISSKVNGAHTHIFCAMIAQSPSAVRQRLRFRYGALLEDAAIVRLGFDWSEPMACSMVSDAMADLLIMAAQNPTSPIAAGLDFQIEQRFDD